LISFLILIPAALLVSMIVCWILFKRFKQSQGLLFVLLGIQFTILGLSVLVLWKLTAQDSVWLMNFAIFLSVLGTVLSIAAAFKQN